MKIDQPIREKETFAYLFSEKKYAKFGKLEWKEYH